MRFLPLRHLKNNSALIVLCAGLILSALSWGSFAQEKQEPVKTPPAQPQEPKVEPKPEPNTQTGALTSKDFDQFSWRHIGPWPFSGRITNFAVPPGQSQTYYVLTATGGLWKTVDGGIHFDPLFEKYGTMSMGYLAIAPSKPDILYLGTGESINARAAYHGMGMFKSADAGKTWTPIGLEKSFFIPKVEVDPRNPDVVYAAAVGKLYDNAMDCERGLYKTTDGGKTWARVLDLKDRGVTDFVMDPKNPDVLIAAAYKNVRRTWTFIDRQEGNILYKTTDGGKTWKPLTNGLPDAKVKTGRNGVTLYEKNPNILYARIDEEIHLGLSEEEKDSLFGETSVFEDGYYFNKWKTFKIAPELAKLVKFMPPAADTEKDLAKKLNDLVKDRAFLKTIGLDWTPFLAAARKVYAKSVDKNKDYTILDEIAEVEKTVKRDAEKKDPHLKINRLILQAFFGTSEGISFKDDKIMVTDAAKIKLQADFNEKPTYDAKTIKDEADLIAKIAELAVDPEFTTKLKINAKSVMSTALKTHKDNKELAEAFKDSEALAEEFDQTKFRYRTLNGAALRLLYGGAFGLLEPVKKAGIVYSSEDQGETWKPMTEYKMTGGSDVVNQVEAGYNGRLLVDPNDDKVVYAHETRTVISRDGGKTFKFPNWENKGVHVDSRAVWVDPLNSRHILNANDGGVSESWDGGDHWSQKETISAQQFYDITVDDEISYNVMGGTQDNGSWIGPSRNRNPNGVFPADWTYLPSGDGFWVVRDWWNPEYIYYESQFGYSSRQNLKTGETISLSRRNTPEENAAGNPPQRYQWNAPIVLSPHNPGIVFVCSQYVHRSLSRGEKDTWSAVSPDLTKADKKRIELSKKTNLQYATIFSFAESPKKPGLYWAGTDDGNLQLSTDGGVNWTNITAQFYGKDGKAKKGVKGALIPYDRWVKRVLPSRHDEKTCYVAYSGYRTHNEDTTHLYVTRDLGKTWEDISGGMNNPVSDIEEDPDNPEVLYLATDYGLFLSLDRGKSWAKFSTTAPHVIIKDLAIQKRDRDLVIGTYGRGIYIADIFPVKEFKADVFAKDAHLFDIEDVIRWTMFDRRGNDLGEIAKAVNPQVGASFTYFLKNAATKVQLTVKDLEGNLIQEVKGKTEKGLQKVVWNLSKKVDQDKLEGLSWEERGKLTRLDPGTYLVTLTVDGKDAGVKKVRVLADPAAK
ncbi:MAG: hypothetical protein MUQ00_04880 [Candidatus Aminicenantes bacterium]|nr:hypothetical protein [Candidatus Aminicenantes bacterium]